MPIEEKKIKKLLEINFPDAEITLIDMVGDGDHYALEITSVIFEGKTLIQQHRLVNQALAGYLGADLHALKIKTKIKKE